MPVILIKPKKVVRQFKNSVNCAPLEDAMSKIKLNPTNDRLTNLMKVLNDLFKGTDCKGVIYTKNTDKPFFGMCVMPVINETDVKKMILENDFSTLKQNYFLEFDSKLFEIGLSTRELVAVVLHEIGHIILDIDKAVDEVTKSFYMYLQKNMETIDMQRFIKYADLLAFGFRDAIRKINNIFSDEETNADSYAVALGYGQELISALKKITDRCTLLNKDLDNKLLVLQWTLRLYKNMKLRRIPAIRTLERTYQMTGSELEKREINKCMNAIKQYEYDAIDESAVLEEKAKLSIFRRFKYKGMRGIEDDLYGLTLRVKSVDEQDEALMILRDINSRLAILDDYISSEDLDQNDLERWNAVRKKYLMLREELSKKTTYDDKYYGLFIKTPVVKSRYEY